MLEEGEVGICHLAILLHINSVIIFTSEALTIPNF